VDSQTVEWRFSVDAEGPYQKAISVKRGGNREKRQAASRHAAPVKRRFFSSLLAMPEST